MNEAPKHGKEINLEELKVLQMDVLSAIDEFCRKNDLKYSMGCGTMLGAVRHKGYIPWDDDIDIYLLRDDYEQLMKLFPEVFKGHYCISSLERYKNWDFPYAKAYDNRTVVYEKAYHNESFGVNIDIFPIDEVPDDENEWRKYDDERRKLYNKQSFLVAYTPFCLEPMSFAVWLYYGIRRFFHSRRKRAERIDEFAKKYRGRGYHYVFECCMGMLQKHPFKKELFDHIVEYPFEDKCFKGFENYDEYLSNAYGNYMQLPPVEKRVTHHTNKAYWK